MLSSHPLYLTSLYQSLIFICLGLFLWLTTSSNELLCDPPVGISQIFNTSCLTTTDEDNIYLALGVIDVIWYVIGVIIAMLACFSDQQDKDSVHLDAFHQMYHLRGITLIATAIIMRDINYIWYKGFLSDIFMLDVTLTSIKKAILAQKSEVHYLYYIFVANQVTPLLLLFGPILHMIPWIAIVRKLTQDMLLIRMLAILGYGCVFVKAFIRGSRLNKPVTKQQWG